jgi:hypothetical protein
LPDFSRMLESVARPHLCVAVIAHDVGKAQRAQCVADAGQTALQRARELARAHLAVLQQQLDDGEGNGIPKHPAQARLPVALFFHAVPFITFSDVRKSGLSHQWLVANLRNCAILQRGFRKSAA